jgi:hypothetical protein
MSYYYEAAKVRVVIAIPQPKAGLASGPLTPWP